MATTMVQAPVKQVDFIPLIYGSVAFSLGKTEDGTTHRWTIYVRGVNGKDLTGVLSKVVFKLHPTCNSPVVECMHHPFETTQPGWGEFPATIEVSFKDEQLPTITFTHTLRLHHPVNTTSPIPTTKPVVHETYEEVVFRDPTLEFCERLQVFQTAPFLPHALSPYWKTFSEEADLMAIQKAHAFIKTQLEIVVNEYGKVDVELMKLNKAKQHNSVMQEAKQPLSSVEAPVDSHLPQSPQGEMKPEFETENGGEEADLPEAKRMKMES